MFPKLICLILIAAALVLGEEIEKPDPTPKNDIDRLALFLSGCELLKANTELGDSARAHEMKTLEHLSGITAEKATRMVRGYRNRVDAWQKVLERMDWYLGLL